jgi:hypothetical protein
MSLAPPDAAVLVEPKPKQRGPDQKITERGKNLYRTSEGVVPFLLLAALPQIDLPLHFPQGVLGGGQLAGDASAEILADYAATNQSL